LSIFIYLLTCENVTPFVLTAFSWLVDVTSVRIGDVVMTVIPSENPELVPEVTGPFYDEAQVHYRTNLTLYLYWVLSQFFRIF
jgi:hypothetical protein